MHTLARLCLLSAAALSLSACFDKEQSEIQSKICIYNTDPQAERCKAGQMAWFRPDDGQLISEQMALSVVVVFCFFVYLVMQNRAGVVCVFTDQRLGNVQ